jgi:RsiW-degrading membrane proteinase PrsW (M82 family)
MVFPLLGGRSTWSQEHLLPILMTLLAGILLFAVPFPWPQLMIKGVPAKPAINEAWQVFSILAIYIAFMVNYYINQMCGRARPGWVLAGVALFTFLMLGSLPWDLWYDLFYYVIPGESLEKSSNPVASLAGFLFGTGLCEEGFKAWPLFGLVFIGAFLGFLSRRTKGRLSARLAGLRKRMCLCEPLDGIVLGVASGSGFFIKETLGQYLPQAMGQAKYASAQAFEGLVLLLARGLPELAEHSAWAGLFGYFIGLSVLQPRMAIYLLPLGWLSAAALHGAWDGLGGLTDSTILSILILVGDGLLSYALLGGALFKAREISLARVFGVPAPVAPEPAIAAVTLSAATVPLSPSEEAAWD